MKRRIFSASDSENDRLDEFLDVLKSDFDYIVEGLDKLGRSGVNSGNDALAIAESLQSSLQDTINEIAQKVIGDYEYEDI